MADLIYREECYAIIGACYAVYTEKGCGFLEPIYQECLEIELAHLHIPFVPKPKLALQYRGITLQHTYEPDFICHDTVVVEIKAVTALCDEHRAQLLNYLSATGHQLGLLVNFGHYPQMEWERIAHTRARRPAPETVRLH